MHINDQNSKISIEKTQRKASNQPHMFDISSYDSIKPHPTSRPTFSSLVQNKLT